MTIHRDAWISPHAIVDDGVVVGARARVAAGAILSGPVEIGEATIVMEQAVIRGTERFPTRIGSHCLVGPHASLSGCSVEDEVFLATGSSLFPGAVLGRGSEVRINGVVQLRTALPPGATVPIGWVAVGDPVLIAPPGDHERIWEVQRELDFPGFVFGVDRSAPDAMVQITERLSAAGGRGSRE